MWQGFTGWHALIILVVILLLFGAPKLPALARSLGQSMKILKSEVRSDQHDESTDEAAGGAGRANSTDDPGRGPRSSKPADGTEPGSTP